MPSEPFPIQTLGFRGIARDNQIGRNILYYNGRYGSKTVTANSAILMDTGKSSKCHVIMYPDVARQCRIIREDIIVSDNAIMCNMDICHDPVVIPDSGNTPPAAGPPVDGTIFPDGITIADFQV
jgi:hypothetical protein